jgi:hypothetical protein
MGAPQYEQAGADVAGSGTPGTIPVWSSGTTLGNSVIVQNGTNIGVNTATPIDAFDVRGGSPAIVSSNSQTRYGYTQWMNSSSLFRMATDGAFPIAFFTAGTRAMTIDASQNVGIGTASPGAKLEVSDGANGRFRFAGSLGTAAYADVDNFIFRSSNAGLTFGTFNGSRLDISTTAGYGIKLPATPGNGNANTLDAYQEGTRVLAAGDLSGWTYVTATQYWTLVGRTVTLHTVFTGGTSSATGGATIATPPLLTPLRIAAGAAVNSAGTALGNGVSVVGPTSGTTGTVTTSNAISSSAVDKVITVTYETAGL